MLIYFADLSHLSHVTKTFPLGISCVAAYAKQEFGDRIDVEIFKLPNDLQDQFFKKSPDILCLSNYPWNFNLACNFAKAAKENHPDLITVFGGPNFPLDCNLQFEFLRKYNMIDFYIYGEGEDGFVELVRSLISNKMDASFLKRQKTKICNCIYCYDDLLIQGENNRIINLDKIPSPYLSGLLDKFFDQPLIPLMETTRGCPFCCTFCGSGLEYKSKVVRYSRERIIENINYIAEHVKHCDELILSDLNFGMYDFDIKTCQLIAGIQAKKGYPKVIKASAGKNNPDTVFDAVKILNNSWHVGLALQSIDSEILAAIKRNNISYEKMIDLAKYGKDANVLTYTEIILGLPNDSKEKHYKSLRFAVDSDFNSIRMYQLFLLSGTELATLGSRDRYGMITKWRVIPGCIGRYDFFNRIYCIGEPEEIVVSNNTMSWTDYLDCRLMDCIVEIFFNNAWFEELFSLIRVLQISPFDFLLYFKNHSNLYSETIEAIFHVFLRENEAGIYDSREEVENILKQPGIVDKYFNGDLGSNEILNAKALCYRHFEETNCVVYKIANYFLKECGLLTSKTVDYLKELERFNFMAKSGLFEISDRKYSGYFKYNFKNIQKQHFKINPELIKVSDDYFIEMFHTEEQKSIIKKLLNVYGLSLSCLGKLIQRVNFKEIYRNYEQQIVSKDSAPLTSS